MEYVVLLNSLAKSGISGKSWHLIKQWYTGVKSLLVMDPFLIELKSKSCGLNMFGLDIGDMQMTFNLISRTVRNRSPSLNTSATPSFYLNADKLM